MPNADPVNWQPISQMPLIASMIDDSLRETREHLQTLTKARARPHELDDATIDRVEQVHTEQMEFVDIYTQQISRWRTEAVTLSDPRPGPNGNAEPAASGGYRGCPRPRPRASQRHHRARLAMSDLELGLQSLLGTRLAGKR
jgi:hypothetical protein